MPKEHDKWIIEKKRIDAFSTLLYFQEREIWWCSYGANVGHEQDGQGELFERPVLIIKKFNLETCWILPLTTSEKENKYKVHVIYPSDESKECGQVILSQLKLIDQKRLSKKVGVLSRFQFEEIRKSLIEQLSS